MTRIVPSAYLWSNGWPVVGAFRKIDDHCGPSTKKRGTLRLKLKVDEMKMRNFRFPIYILGNV